MRLLSYWLRFVVVGITFYYVAAQLQGPEYPATYECSNPWFLTRNTDIGVNGRTLVLSSARVNDTFAYILTGTENSPGLSLFQYSQNVTSLYRINLNSPHSLYQYDSKQSTSTAAVGINPSNGAVYVLYMYGDRFTIQFYNASSLNFTATPRTVNFTTQVHYGNLLGSTISNPQIVASVGNGRLMIGIYQHDEAIANTSATTWFLGEFTADATPVLLNSHQEQEMAYNIRYTNGQFRVQTAYNVSYYQTTINGFVLDRRNPCSELLQNQILHYSVSAIDSATNNSYFLFQEPDASAIDKKRIVVYHLSYNDTLIKKKVLAAQIPLNYSNFNMDIAVKNSEIYIVHITDQSLVYTPFGRDNRRNGDGEIVAVQLNKTDLSYLAYGGFSTANEDYIFKILNVGNTGSFSLLGITDGELARGWFPSDINRRLFVAQFGYLRITNIVTPPSPSNSPGLRIRSGVRFSVSFSHSITSLDLPIVYIRQSHKPFAPGSNIVSSTWNGTHLNVLPINDVGSSLELTLVFNSYTLTPLLVNQNLKYEPPRLTRQDPLRGPTYGETPLFITGVNLGEYLAERSPEDLVITIGNRTCTKFIHYDAMDFSCQVPAGRGKAQPLRVIAGGNIGLPTTTYAYDAPSITSITPTTGPLRGNISMTIQGQNFGTDMSDSDTVTIGGRPCPIEFTSFRTIICRVPAGIGGSLNVNVTILDQSAVPSQRFSYDVPVLDSIFPNKLSNNESFAILKGRNLGNNTSQIVIQLRHPNGTIYSACSSVSILSGEPENGIINCTLVNSLPRPVNFRVIANAAGQLSSELVTLETGSSNIPPSVVSQTIFIDEDSSVSFQLNASDADNATLPLVYYIVKLPTNGSLLDRGSNVSTTASPIIMDTILQSALTSRYLLYVPDNEFNGMDNLIFRACDQFTCAPTDGMITFNVTSANDPPIAFNQTITMYEDTSVGITLNFSDIDSNVENCSITLKTLPPGKISTNDTTEIKTVPYRLASPYLVYTSPQNAAGPPPNFVFANFTFVVSDGISSSTIGVVELQILPVDDMPVSKNISAAMEENTDLLLPLVCTDIDTVPSALFIVITQLPEGGTLYQHTDAGRGAPILGRVDDGQVWFAPSRDYIGQSSFSYECRDIAGVTSERSYVTISVNPKLICENRLSLTPDFLLGNSDIFPISLIRENNSERVTFEIVQTPTRGRLVNQDRQMHQAGTELKTSKLYLISGNQGGRTPYDRFSYIARGPANTSSQPCDVEFTVDCPQSNYLNIFNSSGNICVPCPSGAICSIDGRFDPYATRGFWRSPNDNYLPCAPDIACPGAQNGTCAEGYKGIRCAQCEFGYYKLNNRCLKCNENAQQSTILILLTVLVGAIALLVLSRAQMSGAGFGIINLTINFVQTILIIRNFELEWPEQLLAVLDFVAIVNFNLEYSGPECFSDLYVVDYPLKMKISLLIPFALVAIVGLCALTWTGASKLSRVLKKSKSVERSNNQFISSVKFFNLLLSIAFITVAQNSLSLFDCTYEDDGNYYLDAAPSLICYHDWWHRDLPIAIVAVILYVLGIPIYFFMIYYTSQQTKYSSYTWMRMKEFSTQILHSDRLFHPQHQYFVFIQFMQKIVFVLINMFFTRYVAVQSTLMLYVLLVLFYVYRIHQPYLHPILNKLEAVSLAASLIVLTLGLLFRTDTLRTTEQRLIVTFLILGIVFGFVLLALVAMLYDFQERIRALFRNRHSSTLSAYGRSASSVKNILD